MVLHSEAKPKQPKSIGSQLFHPDQAFKALFHDIQMSGIFTDSKTFVDASTVEPPQDILADYQKQKTSSSFDLKTFILSRFEIPTQSDEKTTSSTSVRSGAKSMLEHLKNQWKILIRSPDKSRAQLNSSLIKLPKPYVVPGGRFREIYYWDSYFTLLGLIQSNRMDLVHSMIDNFAYLIDKVGHIPNGNRTYFLSRSQPPFFGEMIRLIQNQTPDTSIKYLPQLEAEYQFWMRGKHNLTQKTSNQEIVASQRVVKMPNRAILNRYYDHLASPRPESYKEDLELAESLKSSNHEQLYRDIRAACESGWDFSSRWFADGKTLKTIVTTQIIPVDLNVLLYRMELLLSDLYHQKGEMKKSSQYRDLAQQRRQAIIHFLWDDKEGFYRDLNFTTASFTPVLSLAGVFPLWANIATKEQAELIAKRLKRQFLFPGGLVTTPHLTGQQWDYPNGWAPLQWIAVRGLHNYHHIHLAHTVAERWLALNRSVFDQEHKMMEKYNVVNLKIKAGGGEYPTQDGFGWTNGVALALSQFITILNSSHPTKP